MVYDHVEKADLSKGYQNPKRKLGVAVHFSEIVIIIMVHYSPSGELVRFLCGFHNRASFMEWGD